MVTWYWSADTLFWQVSIDHNMDKVQGKPRLHVSVNLLFGVWPPCCSVVVAVVRTRPRAMQLAMITMRKSTHGFPFLSYMSMVLRLATHQAAGALLKKRESQNKLAPVQKYRSVSFFAPQGSWTSWWTCSCPVRCSETGRQRKNGSHQKIVSIAFFTLALSSNNRQT